MRFRDLPRSCRAYVGVVCALALLVVAWAVASTPTTGSLELTALITLTAIAAHASFRAFWPESLSALDLAQPLCLVAGVSAALVFTGANRALVSIAIWLGNGISPREQHMFAFESLLTDGVLLLMGLPLAHLVVIAPWAAAAGAAPLWL